MLQIERTLEYAKRTWESIASMTQPETGWPADKIFRKMKVFSESAAASGSSVSAGFPSPADDYIDTKLDLNEHLIRHPSATFFVRASGDSMIGAGIQDGDLAIIDAHRTPATGDIVAAFIDGAWTLKYFNRKNGAVYLTAANPAYPTLLPREELRIGGVVTKIIKEYY